MDTPSSSTTQNQNPSPEKKSNENPELILNDLPRVQSWDGRENCQYQGFWCPSMYIHGVIFSQKNFRAHDSDIILTSFPKSGTTWLKAILFTLVNRHRFASENNPLLTTFSHELVPILEMHLYKENNPAPNLETFPAPRIFSAHVPYASLPHSVVNTNCRIIYLCRNPVDQFVSQWHFINNMGKYKMLPIEEAFKKMCDGIQPFGPFWEHVLGYWKASIKEPNKILFLKYEDLKKNNIFHIKKLAEFLGCPFSKDEENQDVAENISKLCSFENMKDFEVNKTGTNNKVGNNIYFREGIVGGWKNHISPSMSERLEKLVEEKLVGSGLSFKKVSNMEKDV